MWSTTNLQFSTSAIARRTCSLRTLTSQCQSLLSFRAIVWNNVFTIFAFTFLPTNPLVQEALTIRLQTSTFTAATSKININLLASLFA